MPRRIAVCDCETDPFRKWRVPAPFVWGYLDYPDGPEGPQRFLTFRTTREFIDFIKYEDVICYAHNGGHFDWMFLLHEVEPYEQIMLINGRIAKMNFGAAELRDSYNIVPVPLAAYKKDDIEYDIMEAEKRGHIKNWDTIIAYLHGDCQYLYELVSRFIKDYGMSLTMAGASMKQWRKISPIDVPETTGEFYDEFARFYYGGRVECFASGVISGDYNSYDITSAYPYAMLHKHPYSDNYSRVEGYAKGADFYTVRCRSTGVFPYRDSGAGLSFPNDGEFRTFTVTGWEYQAAIDTFALSEPEVLESITFVNHVDFSPYVLHFYNYRDECKKRGDAAGSLFCKLFMNSLYGKFAANPRNYKNYMVVPPEVTPGLYRLGWAAAGEFGPWILAESPLGEERQRFYNVATGASITGFVRAMLWRAIHTSKGTVYCDTDSITCESAGHGVVLGDELGSWKHEGCFDKLGIAGKKLYIMRGAPEWWTVRDSNGNNKTVRAKRRPDGGERLYKTASKGVRLTHSQLWHVAKGGTVDYVSQAPTFRAYMHVPIGKDKIPALTGGLQKVIELPLSERSKKRLTERFFTARTVRKTAKG